MTIPAETLNNLWQVYYYIALFSTILFVLKLIIFNLFGGGSEVFADFNMEIDTDPSFNFFSVQSILAFLMGFGWTGYAGLKQIGFSHLMSFGMALAVGFLFMAVTALLLFSIKKLEKNIKKDGTTALEHIGKAYTNFEPNGSGQVEIEINGQLSVANATNTTDEEIKAFDFVKAVKVTDDMIYIEKVSNDEKK